MGLGESKMYYIQYVLSMLEQLLQNRAIRLEKFLHDLIPSVISCMVCATICSEYPITNSAKRSLLMVVLLVSNLAAYLHVQNNTAV